MAQDAGIFWACNKLKYRFMAKILFAPLNTNHVHIFESILPWLHTDYVFLSHDNISEAAQYHTGKLMQQKGIKHVGFSQRLDRSPSDWIGSKISKALALKKQVKEILKQVSPDVLVVAIDHDPVSQILIEQAHRLQIKSVLIQEGLIRPHELVDQPWYWSDYVFKILRMFGIHLNYIRYGSAACDRILVSGARAAQIFKNTGNDERQLAIVGQPKYDSAINKLRNHTNYESGTKTYVFAASTTVLADLPNVRFMREMVKSAHELDIHLIIKLHPRAPIEPSDVHRFISDVQRPASLEIIKEGDDTFDILMRSYALVTVSSTMVLEALMMNKECVVAEYLAGTSCLEYESYDAVHVIKNELDIKEIFKNSLTSKKPVENKKKLLNDELYLLDGMASQRAAQAIESMIGK
jgi:hypothetical protein